MSAGPEVPPLNPFAAELRRAAAGAAAPDKAPSLRELSNISGVGRSAIGDWLSGKSLPRSWDEGAVLVVDAIIKLAARYGKRFADEEAVRQRCKDAYVRARSAQHAKSTSGSSAPVPGIDTTATPSKAASQYAAEDGPEPAESGSDTSLIRWWRTKYIVSSIAIFAVLTVTVALILLLHSAPSNCLHESSRTSWGAGEINVCSRDGHGSYSGSISTTDKTPDGYCVRWRIAWDNKLNISTSGACTKSHPTQSYGKFQFNAPASISGAGNAFLEQFKVRHDDNLNQ